ncbi:hypothetical protein Tco_0855726 [Tanacetum coccineum]
MEFRKRPEFDALGTDNMQQQETTGATLGSRILDYVMICNNGGWTSSVLPLLVLPGRVPEPEVEAVLAVTILKA